MTVIISSNMTWDAIDIYTYLFEPLLNIIVVIDYFHAWIICKNKAMHTQNTGCTADTAVSVYNYQYTEAKSFFL